MCVCDFLSLMNLTEGKTNITKGKKCVTSGCCAVLQYSIKLEKWPQLVVVSLGSVKATAKLNFNCFS